MSIMYGQVTPHTYIHNKNKVLSSLVVVREEFGIKTYQITSCEEWNELWNDIKFSFGVFIVCGPKGVSSRKECQGCSCFSSGAPHH